MGLFAKNCPTSKVSMDIRVDDLTGSEIAALLRQHLQDMAQHSPPESIHALDLEALHSPEITFWCAWNGTELMGCGALRELSPQHGEIKSMRTAPAYRRKGVAKQMLEHILAEAQRRGYQRLSLETGSMSFFEPARQLYASYGFTFCAPFADYMEDPNSVCMTRMV